MDSDCCRLPMTRGVLSNKADESRSNQLGSTCPSFSRPRHSETRGRMLYRGPWQWRPWAVKAGARANVHLSKVLTILEKRPGNVARSPLLVSYRRKKTDRGQRSPFPSETFPFAPVILAHKGFTTLLARPRSSRLPPSPNLVLSHLTHPIERYHGTLARFAAPH